MRSINSLKRRRKKALFALAAIGLLAALAAGTTIAWLGAQSAPLVNTFGAAEVTCRVDESFTEGVKSNVSICNTGTMDAYIRVALIPVWKDGDNVAGKAASLADCTIVWGDAAWVRGADGYYYCTVPTPAGRNTPVLINQCTVRTKNDYRFEMQISAQAIQALPVSAVTGIWGSTVTGVKADGTLEVVG